MLSTLGTRGGTRVHSQLPNECDYLPRVLEFMAIIFVIIEISSALWTQKIWWNSHNYSTSTYIWKYISTGLKLEIIFQEELHAHALSWQAEPSFIEEEAHPTENSLCLSACGRHAEEFPRQSPQCWELGPSLPPPVQRILGLFQNWLFSVPASK